MNLSEGQKLIKKKEFGTALKFLLKLEKKLIQKTPYLS